MTERKWLVLRRGWPFELACAATAAVAFLWVLRATSERPPTLTLVGFVLLLLLAENTAVALPTAANVSPSFMMVMAAIASFGSHGVLFGACVVGAAGTVVLQTVRERKLTTVLFNCAQFLLASLVAAAAFDAIGPGHGPRTLLAALVAAVGFGAVNITLVIPQVALNHELRAGRVWADMRPQLPNYFAFGLLGVLVGQLYGAIGLIALPLVFIPAVIARITFSSYLSLKNAHEAAVRVFVRAIDAKDHYTGGHSERVAKYAGYIGEELDFSPERLEHMRYAALLHDVGKLAVPSALLNKPGKLTSDEYSQVQRHNHVCVEILTRVDFLRNTIPAASDKHAHFGEGDEQATAEALEAYAIAVADAFDAMTSTRSYRRALAQDVAFAELRAKSGSQFHPSSAEALVRAIEQRGERYGLGYEHDVCDFDVAPPVVGVGSAGLGDLLAEATGVPA